MRRITFLIISFVIISCSKENKQIPLTQESKETLVYHNISADSVITSVLKIDSLSIVDFYKLDLNNDNFEDLVVLHEPPVYPDDPGKFSTLSIYLTNVKTKSFDSPDIFDVVPEDFVASVHSPVNSDLIGIYPSKNGFMIFAFGYLYGSGRAPSLIIEVSNSSIKQVFNGDYKDFVSLTSLDQTPQLVLRKTQEYWGWVDSLDIILSSYCPYQVLTLNNDIFVLDSISTKSYNENNYVFEGFKYYDPEITVAVPRDGSNPYVYTAN